MNCNLFEDTVRKTGCTMKFLASSVLGITEQTLWQKRNGYSEFKVSEIAKMKKFFKWDAETIDAIFFAA